MEEQRNQATNEPESPTYPLIKANEHVFVAGRTGSGKTFLAKKFLAQYPNVVVLDTKGMLDWNELLPEEKTIVTSLAKIGEAKTDKIIYKPRWQEMDFEVYNRFFKWVYQRKNTIVWVDEVMAVCPNPFKIPDFYKAILTRGRELNIAVWSLTQRPSGIPQIVISEATHLFIFDLNMEQDRNKLTEITGYDEFETRPGKFHFWYADIREEKPPGRGIMK